MIILCSPERKFERILRENLKHKIQTPVRKVRRKSGLNTFDKELIRIVGQHLHSIGLKTSAEVLMAEAGTQLIHPNASNFKKLVLNGEWSQAVRSTYLSFYNVKFIYSEKATKI